MTGYIQVDSDRECGSLAVQLANLIQQVLDKSAELGEALAQAAADDPTNAKLQTLLGTNTPEDAAAVSALVGSIRTDSHNASNAFLQYSARIHRIF